MEKDQVLYCVECGGRVKEDASVGVYLHDSEDTDEGYDLDEDHTATPDWGEDNYKV